MFFLVEKIVVFVDLRHFRGFLFMQLLLLLLLQVLLLQLLLDDDSEIVSWTRFNKNV